MKKLWIGIGIVVVLALAITLVTTQTKEDVKEIKIGVILPLTGELASHGEDGKRGIELAVRLKNETGGVNGRKVRAIYEDDRNNPTACVSSFKKLVETEKVQVILGGMSSTVALAVAPIAQEKGIILFSPTASHPKLTARDGYIFRNWPADDYDAKAMAEFSYKTLHKEKFATLYPNNDNGRALSELFEKHIKELGGAIILTEAYEPGTRDFRSALTKIKGLGPDAIYVPGYYEDVAMILVQAKEIGLKAQFLSSSAVENPKLIELARDAAEGLTYSKTRVDPKSEEYEKFVHEYQMAFSATPGIAASQCFDAVNIIMLTIERGGYSSKNIQQELYKLENYPGVTGKTSFDSSGNVLKEFSIFTVRKREFTQY